MPLLLLLISLFFFAFPSLLGSHLTLFLFLFLVAHSEGCSNGQLYDPYAPTVGSMSLEEMHAKVEPPAAIKPWFPPAGTPFMNPQESGCILVKVRCDACFCFVVLGCDGCVFSPAGGNHKNMTS